MTRDAIVSCALVGAMVLAGQTVSQAQTQFGRGGAQSAGELQVGQAAPEIALEGLLQAPDGAVATLQALRGKAVVLEFWATWCGPCLAAMPHVNELAEELAGEPIRFISVTNEGRDIVEPFLEAGNHELPGWVGLDTDRSLFDTYDVHAIPYTVLIDGEGIVRAIVHPKEVTLASLRLLVSGRDVDLPASSILGSIVDPLEAMPIGSDGPAPVFEALIQPTTSSSRAAFGRSAPRRFDWRNLPARKLIAKAMGVDAEMIDARVALPEQRYDVRLVAQRPEDLVDLKRIAVESAYRVRLRRETRDVTVYALRGSETLAPALGGPPASVEESDLAGGELHSGWMDALVKGLREALGAHVFDETDLDSFYHRFSLRWSPGEPGSLVRAVREQLGLELVEEVRAIEFVVVERAADAG